MSTTSTALMTAEEFMNLPDDDLRHELINGEVIAMPPPGLPHGRMTLRLGASLMQFVLDHELGEVYSDAGIQITWNPDTVLRPDVSFISKERLNKVGEIGGYWQGPPDLAVEVLSPEDRPGKVNKKIALYFSSGTKQVWIVNQKQGTVTVYRSETDVTKFSGSDYLEAPDLLPEFRLSLERIFDTTPRIVQEVDRLLMEPKTSVIEMYEEARRYFMGEGILNKTLARLSKDLEAHGIDYAVIGAAALLAHGYKRLTEDIDLLMTPAGLQKFHDELVGLGYAPSFPGARKRIRSTVDGVSIEVMTTGEYPGDGKPKPVSMPEPMAASVEIDGINFLTLEKLIELKLASGISAAHRLKDLADVQELIKIRRLDANFAAKLDPYVRKKYLELEKAVRESESSQEQE